ncbi:outer membrane lipid asymmetry maintenance protein MlaD [Quisquiliibacterium transsilvanicum]|jgi:phospholipid/cholesterol/gamma-HCH transport system substrate-binding protein|uniref:Phospholipid/cholesterol/gamma-HCH transport system substrate-binding protein n=1 Tax=Quisquiliibacterium transsilvanicum TaxID=1549638 RepID=A0A7W8MA71_9BURK|nr:outer membrane lipid asymmetry maintenance protein MlaD [Quisquiliibacterium transsilvanicum]MBB5273085.1 phospholipid/cholesterol/gamma-HCH transport system substrate-binding protein [Quisquiliibacterium transsilvanicum]
MNRRSVDVLVGLFVLLGFASLAFLAMRAGNMSSSIALKDTYEAVARFDNIGGLKPRAAVRSAGVVVGRVTGITFNDKAYQAEVTLALDRRFAFPKDSSAKIMTSGLLGDQYIGLEPGGDSEMLAQGDVITLTQSAVVLENLIGQFLYGKAAEGVEK